MGKIKQRFLFLILIFSLGLVNCLPSNSIGATLFLDPGNSGFKNKKIYDNWEFLGLIGDYISLPDGDYNLIFNIPRSYKLYTKISIKGDEVKVIEHKSRPEYGVTTYKVDWPKPLAKRHAKLKGVVSLTFSPVKFGRKTGVSPMISACMAGCTKRKVILRVSSKPEDAEIWIDDEKQKFTTNTTLSLPYCTYEKTKRLVLRIPQRVNYIYDIKLSPNKKIEVICELKKPSE